AQRGHLLAFSLGGVTGHDAEANLVARNYFTQPGGKNLDQWHYLEKGIRKDLLEGKVKVYYYRVELTYTSPTDSLPKKMKFYACGELTECKGEFIATKESFLVSGLEVW